MKIRAGYNIAFTVSQPTSMILMLSVHSSRMKDLLTNPRILTEPHLPLREYRDMFGNICTRVTAGPGQIRFLNIFDILDSGRPDEVLPSARQHPIDELPDDALIYLLGSRYATHKSCPIAPGKPLAIPKPAGTWCRRFAILFTTTLNLDIVTQEMTERLLMPIMSGSVYVVTLRTSPWPCAAV
jgi:hypothetical protein